MGEKSELNLLVSHIIDQKRYSHCRLCLKQIREDNFAKFGDSVDYSRSDEFIALTAVLEKLFGPQITEEIPGIDAVCTLCLDRAADALNLIETCENSTRRLNSLIDSLQSTLNTEIETSNTNQKLYIVCNENGSEILIIQEDSKPKKVSKVKCFKCKETFQGVDDLKAHAYNEHDLYTCEKCHFTTRDETVMAPHEQSSELYQCSSSQCPVVRCTENSLREHEDSLHGTHICKECGKSFKGLKKLLHHEEKHKIRNECPNCKKTYTTREFFEKHVKLCLAGLVRPHPLRSELHKAHFCQECGKGYSTKGGLRVHMKFVHGNAEPHVCRECGKKFTAPSYLKAHMITHTGAKNFNCGMCGGKFVTKEALLYHTRRHTGEKPYSCNLCSEKFVNSSSRADHIKYKHIGPTLSCELCARKFVTKNFLRLHMKKHYDPTNKLYIGRTMIPPNMPGQENMRVPKNHAMGQMD